MCFLLLPISCFFLCAFFSCSSFFSSSPVCFFRGHFCCLSFFSLALALLLLLSCSCREFNLCASFLVDMSFLNFIFSPNLSLVTRVVLAPLVPCSFCFGFLGGVATAHHLSMCPLRKQSGQQTSPPPIIEIIKT